MNGYIHFLYFSGFENFLFVSFLSKVPLQCWVNKISKSSYLDKYGKSPNFQIPFINQNPPRNIPFKDCYYNEGSQTLNKSIYDNFSVPVNEGVHPRDFIFESPLLFADQ